MYLLCARFYFAVDCQILNLSFEIGAFPDNLKIGKVNPFYKKDSAENPSNYRPISILSVF